MSEKMREFHGITKNGELVFLGAMELDDSGVEVWRGKIHAGLKHGASVTIGNTSGVQTVISIREFAGIQIT